MNYVIEANPDKYSELPFLWIVVHNDIIEAEGLAASYDLAQADAELTVKELSE
jgi:hypothetical protein